MKETKLGNLQFLTYLTMNWLVFEVLGGAGGDAFSKCIPDLFLEAILGVVFGRLSEFRGDWGSHLGSALAPFSVLFRGRNFRQIFG